VDAPLLAPQHRRGRDLSIVAIVALIVVAVAAGLLAQRSRATAADASYHGPFAPVTLTAGDTVTMAQPGIAAPVLVIYEDFQCPICHDFELANGGAVEKLADQGQVKVVYQLFTIFVGSQPRQANSTRAWAAARCVPAGSWLRYHDLLYAHQPAETAGDGFAVTELLALGRRIGLTSSSFTQCVASQRYAAQIVPISNRLIKDGVNETPVVTLNGRRVSLTTLVSPSDALARAIRAAH